MKTIEVAAAVIKKDNKVFATQRGYGEFKDGWECGGNICNYYSVYESRKLIEQVNANVLI